MSSDNMTDVGVGPLSAEEARIRNAADQAYRVLDGNEDVTPAPAVHLIDAVRARTRQAPLRALAVAFVLGIIFARRR